MLSASNPPPIDCVPVFDLLFAEPPCVHNRIQERRLKTHKGEKRSETELRGADRR